MKSLNQLAEQLYGSQPHAAPGSTEEYDINQEEYTRLKMTIPAGVDINDAIEYGFYEYKNRYWIARPGGNFQSVSNFTMKVKYLIVGAHPKRIVEIKNVHGKVSVLDFAIEDLISMDRFHARTQSQGNFLFEGKATDLAKIKNKLLNEEQPSIEITRLGQHKDQFFAFANGIYDGENFFPVDDAGMVAYKNENYYIPVFGSTTVEDDEDLRNYRKFVHIPSKHTFKEWSALFTQVYGDNGRVGIAFALYAIFSDIVFQHTNAAPMLFLFGQRGSGKGTMALSLLHLWGHPQDPLMLGGASTVVGFMRKLSQFRNALNWFDEYKNDVPTKLIESLKNIWDRIGYERGIKDSTNKTQVTTITSAAMLSGQEMPNVEPALFSRTVLLSFSAMTRSQQEVNTFQQLRKMEQEGITNVLLEIIDHREKVKESFQKNYLDIAAQFRMAFLGQETIERQIVNYSIICAIVMTLEKELALPFTSAELMVISERFMKQQVTMMATSNELQQFFEMVIYLLENKIIQNGRDIHFSQGLVKIRLTSIIPLYREHGTRQRVRIMDRGTLTNYLENSEAYDKIESKKSSHRFPELQSPTSCMVFLREKVRVLYGVDFAKNFDLSEDQQVTKNDPF